MLDKALKALQEARVSKTIRLMDDEVGERLSKPGLLILVDFTLRQYKITPYGKGVLMQIEKACLKELEKYL